MCTEKYHVRGEERTAGLLMLRLLIRKLQRGLSFSAAAGGEDHEDRETSTSSTAAVPDDVKEGHFAVFAVKGGERKRFVVKLEFLNSPAFLGLLEQAEEEYGFEQTGTLVVPCKPEELHKILSMIEEC
ncbi:hypothetical protein L484_002171 [Morus notabilis]|uniref:Uncharacterized protein n=1 Tax=Morus notabilis TaxID=981085 RepID=W9QBF4_9ROSA|nr:auxin-responsive protein SAUR50 [Morus notabilis]EXB22446.1 hypothetical protein L484_002171 [Morus notabilis]